MPTQDPLHLHNIPGDTISASPPGDHRNAPRSTRAPTPTTSFATEFPTPHEIFSTQSQQPHHHTPTVPNTNHNPTTLAQSLKASVQQPKLPKNRTHHNKPSFHNPSELTEYLANNKQFTDNDRYNVSFKLNLPDDLSATFKSFTKTLVSVVLLMLLPSRAKGYTEEIEMGINEMKSHESVSDLPSMFKRPRVSFSQNRTPTESDSQSTRIPPTHQETPLATEDATETTSLTSETQAKQTPELLRGAKVADESHGRSNLKEKLYLSLSVYFLLLDKYSVSSEGLRKIGLL
jgi:hypothetical protein